ncbi:hypothetical protein MUP77_21470 [Candidatus Bathyarchaeota archaeon]|nr:hypothetical protein [Candidatus Bathyarchaeota archaeon]
MEQEIIKPEVSCIFGKHIREECTVRRELNKRQKLDLSKWLKPKSEVFGEAEHLLGQFTEVLNHAYNTLAEFCGVCPYLSLYIEQQTP